MSDKSELEKGIDLVDSGNYAEAYKLLLPYAREGNIKAQAKIGVLYQLGLGVERDLREAIEFLQAAAEKGDGEAAHNLGTLYLSCEPDFPVNLELSKLWYQKAKELGFEVADEEWYK